MTFIRVIKEFRRCCAGEPAPSAAAPAFLTHTHARPGARYRAGRSPGLSPARGLFGDGAGQARCGWCGRRGWERVVGGCGLVEDEVWILVEKCRGWFMYDVKNVLPGCGEA